MSNRSEYRIVLPMSVEEYQVAQLFSVARASKNETGGGEGIEVKENRHFTKTDDFPGLSKPNVVIDGKKMDLPEEGQYTHKIYHLASRVPKFIRVIAPTGSLEIHEKAWNMYPYCQTIITNPDYMKEGFFIKIETLHLAGRGEEENVHGLDTKAWSKTDKVHIDIANDPVASRDYKPEWDPQLVKSQKSGRGPLKGNWKETAEPVMCCYKLVTVCFKWFGLQNKVENFIQKQERRIFFNFHRQVFCWMDEWYGLTMEDIRRIEEETKKELDEQRDQGCIKGTAGDDDDDRKK